MARDPDDELTLRQELILDCICEAVAASGEAPTVREISQHVGLRSISSVHYQLGELERKGIIERDPYKSRRIRLLDCPAVRRQPVIALRGARLS